MVSKSHFVLHSRAVPPLTAGDYVLEGKQRIDDPDGTSYPTETYRGHIRINSPRYRMPPDQILSTFPPANSEGAYESRLPQIVLRRRTLPWERAVDTDRKIPWMALVVIAEGEGALSAESPIADCVTPPLVLSGPNDTPTGVYLSVPQTTVTKVFPTKDDLQLLVHVREVDLSDTELAMGDDDGFLAVVLANRLPQFDRVGCKPVRYLACLINLEGQLDVLPRPVRPKDVFFPGEVVFQADSKVLYNTGNIDKSIMGEVAVNPALSGIVGRSAAPQKARGAADRAAATLTKTAAAAKLSSSAALPRDVKAAAEQWATGPAAIESIAVSAHTKDAGMLVRDAMRSPWRFPLEPLVTEKVYRFPVLTYWSFTCTGAGSFETLMQGLDVGMLGTVAGRPSGKPFPECFQPRGGDAPPDPPPTRPEAELAETGHVGLPHLTRRGESVRAWYRGPLVPNLTVRESAPPGERLPLAHVSDQLRRLVPDGREDLAYACAFEIGRLLALSHPSVVAALARWRAEQFGAARAKRFADVLVTDVAFDKVEVSVEAVGKLGAQLGRKLVELAAKEPERVLGGSRPLVDPGRPIDGLEGELGDIIATGFGLEGERVMAAMRTGDASILESVSVPVRAAERGSPDTLGHLTQGLDEVLERLTSDVLPGGEPPGAVRPRAPRSRREAVPPKERGRSELQRLLRQAARRAREEAEE